MKRLTFCLNWHTQKAVTKDGSPGRLVLDASTKTRAKIKIFSKYRIAIMEIWFIFRTHKLNKFLNFRFLKKNLSVANNWLHKLFSIGLKGTIFKKK